MFTLKTIFGLIIGTFATWNDAQDELELQVEFHEYTMFELEIVGA